MVHGKRRILAVFLHRRAGSAPNGVFICGGTRCALLGACAAVWVDLPQDSLESPPVWWYIRRIEPWRSRQPRDAFSQATAPSHHGEVGPSYRVGGEVCTSHADPGGLSQRVRRPLRDRLDSWIAGMIRPNCTESSRFSRNSWSIPRANLALYYRRPLRRWSAPAAGCSRSRSVLTSGLRGADGFFRHVGGFGP